MAIGMTIDLPDVDQSVPVYSGFLSILNGGRSSRR